MSLAALARHARIKEEQLKAKQAREQMWAEIEAELTAEEAEERKHAAYRALISKEEEEKLLSE
jgi:hypothetical protein